MKESSHTAIPVTGFHITRSTAYYVLFAVICLLAFLLLYPKSDRQQADGETSSIASSDRQDKQILRPDDLASRSSSTPPTNDNTDANSLFDQLLARLHDPTSRVDLSLQEIISSPGFKHLTVEQMQLLANEVMALIERGDIPKDQFMLSTGQIEASTEIPNSDSTLIDNPATDEDRQSITNLKARLRDPEYARTLTARKMLSMPEVTALPAELRQELANEVMQMLSRGELDQASFLAPAITPSDHSQQNIAMPTTQDGTGDMPPATTHEQLQTYENLRSRLHDPTLLETKSIDTILPAAQLKTLPSHLHRQLISEASEMAERGELIIQ